MGQPLTPEYTRRVAEIARAHEVPLHVDGARFWNAVVAQGVRPTDLADPADTVTFCLSKGLACPVGSVVVGRRDVIWRARRARKMVGGGMRQAGILAAAGLVALSEGPDGWSNGSPRTTPTPVGSLRRSPGWMASLPPVGRPADRRDRPGPLDPGRVTTNFVLFRVQRDRAAFLAALRARGW